MTIATTIAGLYLTAKIEEDDIASSMLLSWKMATILLLTVEILKVIGLLVLIIWHIFL